MRAKALSDGWITGLIALTFAIFVGSTAFHALPNRATVLMDVIPIQLFMLAYLALALRRFLGLGWLWVVAGLGLFIAAVALLPMVIPDRRLASVSAYVAALAALCVVGVLCLRKGERAGFSLLAAAAAFAFSLTARQLDAPWCPIIPIGTHWLWHLCNGLVLGVLLLAAIRHSAARRPMLT